MCWLAHIATGNLAYYGKTACTICTEEYKFFHGFSTKDGKPASVMRDPVGISGFSAFVPPYCVSLEDWCRWTGNSWEKIRSVIGTSFRMVGPDHSLYTMAASAVLKLIDQHAIDPRSVGYLAVGTESATDNATSAAVIVRGMVDQELARRGEPLLARDIEAPEIKQACMAGMYGVKGASRYLALDGNGRTAIVVAADLAEYARGSTGEPTQGAGAVAMLLERNPRLLAIDTDTWSSASNYRGVDFRKPFMRYCGQRPGADARPRDYPVFNGKYSTACYSEETLSSFNVFFGKRGGSRTKYIRELAAVFMHRPYQHMPVAAWTQVYLFSLHADGSMEELREYAGAGGVPMNDLLAEMKTVPDLLGQALSGRLVEDPFPLVAKVARTFRKSEAYRQLVDQKMCLGSRLMMELGNLYSASLPAWVAAGLEEAALSGRELDGDLLMVGYGSGDTSEVMAARTVDGWQHHALKTQMSDVLAGEVALTRGQYENLHDGGHPPPDLPRGNMRGFKVERIGQSDSPDFQDLGIEYYRYEEPRKD